MSGAGGLDIRLPIGGLFTVLGLVLGGYGLATAEQAEQYARSIRCQHRSVVGTRDAACSAGCCSCWRRNSRARQGGGASCRRDRPKAQATEEREHRLGLEDEGR